jgi:cytochrome b
MTGRTLVWDPFVRLFHWALVALIGFLWWSGEAGGMDIMEWHMLAGQAVLALLLFRLLWGLAGTRTARFREFLRGPRAVWRESAAMARGEAPAHTGHGALGGWMVVVLLATVTVQAASGLFASDDLFTSGPLTHWVGSATEEFLTGIHHDAFDVLLWLVGLHLAAVLVVYPLRFRLNLIRPMVTGYKRLAGAGIAVTAGVWGRGLALLAVSAAAVAAVIRWG